MPPTSPTSLPPDSLLFLTLQISCQDHAPATIPTQVFAQLTQRCLSHQPGMDESTPSKVKPRRRDPDDTRAERKRIQDRLAQRATRERTKNRIAYLEERLSSLESGDKQGEIASLTRIIDNLRQDNNRLRSAMLKIRTNIDQAVLTTEDQSRNFPPETKPCGCEAKSDCSCAQTPYQHSEPFHPRSDRHGSISTESDVTEVINGPSVGVNLNVAAPGPDTVSHFTGLEDFFDFSPTSLLETFEMGPTAWNTTTPSPYDFHFPSSETSTRIVPDLDKWDVSNGAFVSCLNSVKRRQGSASPSTPDLHVPFKAAIWGWDNVGPEAQHPVWAALRQVDQQVFGTWTSKAQRIALMYVCQTLIQYREHPTKENLDRVPVFLRPR